MKRGPAHYVEAYQSLLHLRGVPLIAAKELFYTHSQIEIERRLLSKQNHDAEHHVNDQKGPNYWQKLGQLFTERRIRRVCQTAFCPLTVCTLITRQATVSAAVCMISQQLCGVNLLQSRKSPTPVCQARLSSTPFREVVQSDLLVLTCSDSFRDAQALGKSPLWLSWGLGLTNFLFVAVINSFSRTVFSCVSRFGIPAYWLIDTCTTPLPSVMHAVS